MSLVLLSVPLAIGQPASRRAGMGGITPRFAGKSILACYFSSVTLQTRVNRQRATTVTSLWPSELNVKPKSGDDDWTTVPVAGMDDTLHVRAGEHATPQVRRVVRLRDVFASVGQRPVAQQEPLPPEPQVRLMVGGDAIRDE